MSETYAKKSSRATQQQTRTARKKKKLTADSRRRARRAGEVAALLPESRDGLLGLMQESMQTFAVEVGALVARELLEDEIVKVCGPRYERVAERLASRHGHQSGFITIAGQKVRIEKPRARSQDGGELELESYAAMQDDQVMPQATLQRMVRGVSCRDYEGVIDTGREAFGVKKSSVSPGPARTLGKHGNLGKEALREEYQ